MNTFFSFFETRLSAFPDNKVPLPKDGLFKFLWACTSGLRGWLLLFMILTAGIGVYEALLYAWIGDLVDWMGTYTPATLWQDKNSELKLMFTVLVLSPFWVGLVSLIHFQVIQGVFPMQMRWRFHKRMLGQSMQFYQNEFSGRVSAKVMQTALAVRDTVITVVDMMTYVLVFFVTSGIILFQLDSLLLIPFAIWLVMFSATLWYFLPKLRDTASTQANARALMTGRITDAYANIMTVKLFSHSRRELGYAKSAMQQFLGTVHAQMRWVTILEFVNHVVSVTLIGSTAAIGLYLWQRGDVGVGALAVATAMALRLNGLTHWIMWQMASLFESIGTVQDGIRTLSAPQKVADAPNAKKMVVTNGHIVFENVDFGYEGTDQKVTGVQVATADDSLDDSPINKTKTESVVSPLQSSPQYTKQTSEPSSRSMPTAVTAVSNSDAQAHLEQAHYIKLLDNFNLEIKSGEKIGLVGRSGAGKSTLVNLLLRFYDVDSGRITIDDQVIDNVTQESLRQQIGMVTQDTSLLHRTVRENIAYGQPTATDAEIIAACQAAQAWDFIQDLHDAKGNKGLDTQVGERGVKLSGGQRQRIAIARVMLKNAPILLLDEATSALDSEVEYAITQSLHAMMEGKTVIAIAHRLSTIAELDRLVVMDKGRIIEQGSHDELLALNGVYAGLWQRQSGGFLGEDE